MNNSNTEHDNERPIETVYYSDKQANKIVKINKSKHPRKAIMNATDKLDNDYYDAWIAVIWNTETYELIRILIKHPTTGRLEIMFEQDPKKPVCLTNIHIKLADDNYRVVHKEQEV